MRTLWDDEILEAPGLHPLLTLSGSPTPTCGRRGTRDADLSRCLRDTNQAPWLRHEVEAGLAPAAFSTASRRVHRAAAFEIDVICGKGFPPTSSSSPT